MQWLPTIYWESNWLTHLPWNTNPGSLVLQHLREKVNSSVCNGRVRGSLSLIRMQQATTISVCLLQENAIMPLKQSAGDSIPLNICNDRSQDWHLSVSEQHAVAEYSLELHKSPHPYDRIGPLASDARERKSLLGNGSHGQITFSMFDGQ
ncbi:hypothetical protein OPV22_019005 [Ensete ventricosum]|uniref:Uncharacterized protein n=1 Tax=Ensete ventricosum TaxID=4639 RepID=A0AAV8PGT5_ENSVE|nr:hypothetical protein OPV22_019005 [Ensete ventricosum]